MEPAADDTSLIGHVTKHDLKTAFTLPPHVIFVNKGLAASVGPGLLWLGCYSSRLASLDQSFCSHDPML